MWKIKFLTKNSHAFIFKTICYKYVGIFCFMEKGFFMPLKKHFINAILKAFLHDDYNINHVMIYIDFHFFHVNRPLDLSILRFTEQ